MDLTALGLEAVLIATIIAVTKVLTQVADPGKRFERWYPLIPLILAIPVAVLRYWNDGVVKIALQTITYGAISAYVYKTGKTTVLGQ